MYQESHLIFYFRNLCVWYFLLANELFAKAFQRFETCLSVSINLRRKLVLLLELPVVFDDNFKVSPVVFFVADFNFLSCELDR